MRRLTRILLAIVLATSVVTAFCPAIARGDGDPASDALLGLNVFYPYDPPVPQAVQRQLQKVVNRAHGVELPVKVALITRPLDLGAYPSVYGKPQRYAALLEREISYQGPQPLLVVMYDGYGLEGFGAQAQRALASLPRPGGTRGDNSTRLARAAAAAIPVLARADGHPLDPTAVVGSANGTGTGSDTRRILLIAMILAAVVVAALILLLRLRQAINDTGSPGRSR